MKLTCRCCRSASKELKPGIGSEALRAALKEFESSGWNMIITPEDALLAYCPNGKCVEAGVEMAGIIMRRIKQTQGKERSDG